MSIEYKRQEGQTYDSWLAIVVIVNSILLESGIPGVIVSKRLLQAFKKRLVLFTVPGNVQKVEIRGNLGKGVLYPSSKRIG